MIKINVSSILEDSEISEKLLDEEVEKLGSKINLVGKLRIKGKIYKISNGVLADMEISGKEKITCDRCLEEFEKTINKKISQEFVSLDKNLQGEEKDDKQAGFIIDEKNEIDLEKPIIEEILLDNERNICKNSCKGLCPKCGVNLNRSKCKCKNELKKEEVKNPFQKLKSLKEK